MTGEKFEFMASAKAPGGDGVFRFRWTLQPGKKGPPEHIHDDERETFAVVSGTLRIWIDKKPRDLSAGESVTVECGQRHRFLNPGKAPVIVDVSLDGPRMEDGLVPLAYYIGDRKAKLGDVFVMMVTAVHVRANRAPYRVADAIIRGITRVIRLFGVKPLPPAGSW